MAKKIVVGLIALAVAAGIFLVMQLIPIYPLTNPPVIAEPPWDSPQTRELARRACFDCHSNETRWPWYAHVAPMRWLVVRDVEKGRATFNFSDWHSGDMAGGKAAEQIEIGRMPLARYRWLHPEARLTETEKQRLMEGLVASMK